MRGLEEIEAFFRACFGRYAGEITGALKTKNFQEFEQAVLGLLG